MPPSLQWCPPCRGFTPQLAKCYKDSYSAKGLEVVFVSSDRDEPSFKSYFGEEQPWLALPYSARDIKAKLSKKYKVSGIPSFVVLDGETGATITTDGRECVGEDPTGKDFPWKPPSFWDALGSEFLSGTEGDTVDVDELKSSAKYIGLYFSAHVRASRKGSSRPPRRPQSERPRRARASAHAVAAPSVRLAPLSALPAVVPALQGLHTGPHQGIQGSLEGKGAGDRVRLIGP